MKLGRYRLYLGRSGGLQTRTCVIIRHFLCFTIVKEAHPLDIDKKQQFQLGTTMIHEGRKYMYCKASKDIKVGGKIERIG